MATRIGGRRPEGRRRIVGYWSDHQRLVRRVNGDPDRPAGRPRRLVVGFVASLTNALSGLAHAGPATTGGATRAGSGFAIDG